MRVVVIESGVVVNAIVLDDTMTLDPDGSAARGPASYEIETPEGAETVEYEAVYPAPVGSILLQSDTAGAGWTFDGTTLSPPAEPLPSDAGELKAVLRAYARTKSYMLEVAGITVSGSVIPTDRETQGRIERLYAASQRGPDRTFHFDTGSKILSLTATDVTALAEAVSDHVQDLADRLASVLTNIDVGTITDQADIDAGLTEA